MKYVGKVFHVREGAIRYLSNLRCATLYNLFYFGLHFTHSYTQLIRENSIISHPKLQVFILKLIVLVVLSKLFM